MRPARDLVFRRFDVAGTRDGAVRLVSPAVFKVLENICLLVRRVIPDVLLDSLNLLDQVKLVLLGQLVEI